jgi:hypothetical protein
MTKSAFNAMPSRSVLVAILLGLIAFYAITMPKNTVEAIDGYDYALAAETIPLAHTHDTRSILFHKINRIAYVTAAQLKPDIHAYELLRWQSILVAAGAVLLFARLMIIGFEVAPTAAWIGAGFLAANYGFWRYGTEVEVYAASTFLILATLNIIIDAERRAPTSLFGLVPAGMLGGLAASYYQPNAIALFLAAPVLLLSRQSFWRFAAYGATGTLVVIAILCAAYGVREQHLPTIAQLLHFINERGEEFPTPHLSLWSFGQATLSVSHDLVSSHWLYGFDSVTRWLATHIPKRFHRFEETIYAAQRASALVNIAAIAFALLIASSIALLTYGVRHRARAVPIRLVAYMVAWFLIHTAVTVVLDPSTEEPWIIATTPLIVLLTVFCIAPACANGGERSAKAALACLVLVNYFGGVAIYANPDHERRRVAMAYLNANARPGDVLVASSSEHSDWLHARYRIGMTVIRVTGDQATTWGIDPHANIKGTTENLIRTFADQGHTIYALARAFEPGDRVKIREGEAAYQDALTFSKAWRSRAKQVANSPFGAVYTINPRAHGN